MAPCLNCIFAHRRVDVPNGFPCAVGLWLVYSHIVPLFGHNCLRKRIRSSLCVGAPRHCKVAGSRNVDLVAGKRKRERLVIERPLQARLNGGYTDQWRSAGRHHCRSGRIMVRKRGCVTALPVTVPMHLIRLDRIDDPGRVRRSSRRRRFCLAGAKQKRRTGGN